MKPEREHLIAEVRRLADAGGTSGEIAARLGMTRGAVMGIIARAGIVLANARGSAPVRLSHGPERVAQVAELAAKGTSADAIAAEIGISPGAVSGICSRYGIRRGAKLARRPVLPADGRDTARTGCRWPMWGHQEQPTHEHCGAEPEGEGRPYCKVHADRAYARGAAAARAAEAIDDAAAEGLDHPVTKRFASALDALTAVPE